MYTQYIVHITFRLVLEIKLIGEAGLATSLTGQSYISTYIATKYIIPIMYIMHYRYLSYFSNILSQVC